MDNAGSLSPPRQLYLFTYPRSGSNLLLRILALHNQQNVVSRVSGGYFFLPAFKEMEASNNTGKHIEQWAKDEIEKMKRLYQECFDDLEGHVQTAHLEQKTVFVKEHIPFMIDPVSQTNFLYPESNIQETPWKVGASDGNDSRDPGSVLNGTVLPDEFLQNWLPTFLIRHPALAFPSFCRAMRDTEPGGLNFQKMESRLAHVLTLHWTRTLYDWYVEYRERRGGDIDAIWPVILDADDVMTEPKVIIRFAEIIGLDPTKLMFTWNQGDNHDVSRPSDPAVQRMMSTLLESSGVVKGKTSDNTNIEQEKERWEEEFGTHESVKLEQWVRAALPDYEYLKARKLRLTN